MRLQQHGLSAGVIVIMMGSRAQSMSKLYAAKWSVFVGWCAERWIQPESCAVELILGFLRPLFDKGRAASTIRVYAAAISACHEGFPKGPVFSHPYVKRFLKGCVRLCPVSHTVVPSWDLQLVLRALCRAPFEPLSHIPLKVLSMLLALASAKRVGDLCALSVSESCLCLFHCWRCQQGHAASEPYFRAQGGHECLSVSGDHFRWFFSPSSWD